MEAPLWSSLDACDTVFLRHLTEIQKLYLALPRASQIRVEHWCMQLSFENTNDAWRRSRNQYAELLLRCVRKGALGPPFTHLPPSGPLPQLPSEVVLSLRANRRVKAEGPPVAAPPRRPQGVWGGIFSSIGTGGYGGGDAEGAGRGRAAPPPMQQQPFLLQPLLPVGAATALPQPFTRHLPGNQHAASPGLSEASSATPHWSPAAGTGAPAAAAQQPPPPAAAAAEASPGDVGSLKEQLAQALDALGSLREQVALLKAEQSALVHKTQALLSEAACEGTESRRLLAEALERSSAAAEASRRLHEAELRAEWMHRGEMAVASAEAAGVASAEGQQRVHLQGRGELPVGAECDSVFEGEEEEEGDIKAPSDADGEAASPTPDLSTPPQPRAPAAGGGGKGRAAEAARQRKLALFQQLTRQRPAALPPPPSLGTGGAFSRAVGAPLPRPLASRGAAATFAAAATAAAAPAVAAGGKEKERAKEEEEEETSLSLGAIAHSVAQLREVRAQLAQFLQRSPTCSSREAPPKAANSARAAAPAAPAPSTRAGPRRAAVAPRAPAAPPLPPLPPQPLPAAARGAAAHMPAPSNKRLALQGATSRPQPPRPLASKVLRSPTHKGGGARLSLVDTAFLSSLSSQRTETECVGGGGSSSGSSSSSTLASGPCDFAGVGGLPRGGSGLPPPPLPSPSSAAPAAGAAAGDGLFWGEEPVPLVSLDALLAAQSEGVP